MRQVGIWFYLSCKRYLKRISFLLILLMFPVGAYLISQMEQKEETVIPIAIYLEENQTGALGQSLIQTLTNREEADSLFRFYECTDLTQLYEDVASRRAESGYVIGERLEEKLDQEDFRRCINVYTAPSTVTAALSDEVVFSHLIALYDENLLKHYVTESPIFEPVGALGSQRRKELAEEAGALYHTYQNNGSTFRFEYDYLESSKVEKNAEEERGSKSFPLRGMVAIYVFVTGLFSAVLWLEDIKKGLFLPIAYELRLPCQVACLAAPVLLAAGSGLVALWAGEILAPSGYEFLVMSGYILTVVLFSGILGWICRSAPVLCCLIPFFIIGSFVFCPIILDIGMFLPAFEKVGMLFLPYYYLNFF